MCSLDIRSLWTFAKARGLSAAVLFIDIIGAFDSLIRSMVFGMTFSACEELSDEHILSILTELGFTKDDLRRMLDTIIGASPLDTATVPSHLQKLLQEAHRYTWHSVQGSMCINQSALGSLPGDPLGDLIFNILAATVLNDIADEAFEADLIMELRKPPVYVPRDTTSEPLRNFDSTFVDDSAFKIVSKTPLGVVNKATTLTQIVVKQFRKRGLRLNFKLGKSELLVKLRGEGRALAEHSLFSSGTSTLPIATEVGMVDLRLSKCYKHMGGVTHIDGSMGDEIALRTGSTYKSFNPVRKTVFSNNSLPHEDRHHLADALLFSRLFYNSATWESLRPSNKNRLYHCYFTVFRVIHNMINVKSDLERPHFSNDQVIVAANIMHPEVCLTLNRLRFFIRFICHAPIALTRFVLCQFESSHSWIELVLRDLEFVWNSTESVYTSMANPRVDFQGWIDAMCSHPTHWKNTFRKACLSFRGKICLRSQATDSSTAAAVPLGVLTCDKCSFACFSVQQLASHSFDVHDYVNPLRLRIQTPLCLHCGTDFHSRRRLFRHLSRRPTKNKCANAYESLCPMTKDELKELDKSEPVVDKRAFLPPPVKL